MDNFFEGSKIHQKQKAGNTQFVVVWLTSNNNLSDYN